MRKSASIVVVKVNKKHSSIKPAAKDDMQSV
jgi:hypothetical protein